MVTEARSEATPAEDERLFEIPCLWFFLPLPHPLGLPHGWRSERPLSPAAVLIASAPTSGLASSLLIHQLDPSVQPVLTDIADLWLFAVGTMKNEAVEESGARSLARFAKETGGDLSSLHTVRRIAEVAVPGVRGGDERQVLKALDLAIDHVRFLQRAVALATQQPVELMSARDSPADGADLPRDDSPESRRGSGTEAARVARFNRLLHPGLRPSRRARPTSRHLRRGRAPSHCRRGGPPVPARRVRLYSRRHRT